MADIRINDLPTEASPTPSEVLAIDGATTRKSTIQNVVDSGAPVASQSLAETGTDNNARMTALSTKQAIDFNSVPLSRTVTAGSGLSGGGPLSANISIALSSSSLSSLALANSAVQPSRQIIAGTGLSGGGTLSADVTINLSTATQTSLGLANTAIQDGSNALVPNGGTLGQVLVKNSNTNRDTGWATVAAATAVSYSAQSLTAAQQFQARSNISASLTGHMFGLNLSNNSTDISNDIDISVGECASTEANPALMAITSTLTKRIDASWAVGSGNGGLDTGVVSDGTWHLFLIQRSDTGVVDALFSQSVSSPTMPSGYDRKRRIGSFVRSFGVNRRFIQFGDYFKYITPVNVRNSTIAVSPTLLNMGVPTDIIVMPILRIALGVSTGNTVTIALGDAANASPNIPLAFLNSTATQITTTSDFITDTSGRLWFSQVNTAGAAGSFILDSLGYIDTRGK